MIDPNEKPVSTPEDEFDLSEDELHDADPPEAWEDRAAREYGVPRFGEI